jgi:hypothetical protein
MKVGVDCVHDGVLSGDIIVGALGVDATDVLMFYNARERADVNGFGRGRGRLAFCMHNLQRRL